MAEDMRPFAGLKVIELSEDAAGEMTGRCLADLGAAVVKIEPPEGAASRRIGPFARGVQDGEHSLHFWFYNPGKKSVTLDLETGEGMAGLRAMLADADVLVAGFQPARLRALGLDYDELQQAFPQLVIVSVTPYGLTGPWADYLSSDLLALAGGGQLNVSGYDDHSIPPIRPGGNQGYHIAASFGLAGAEIALLQRQMDGLGQLVDVSMHECCAITVELAFAFWEYQKAPMLRQTCRHAQPMLTHCALFECADGRFIYAVIMLAEPKPWKALVAWMDEEGMAIDLTEDRFFNSKYRQENFGYVSEIVECFFLTKTAEEAYREGQRREIPIGMLHAPEELLDDPHLEARGFWKDVQGLEGTIRYPGSPYVFSGFDIPAPARPPLLGEHNRDLQGAALLAG